MTNETQPPQTALAMSLVGLYLAIQRIYALTSRDLGLTPQQAQLLCEADSVSPALGELATELGCDKANITGLVDRIAKRGLLERIGDKEDRRVIRVQLTDEGRRLVRRLEQQLETRLGDLDLPVETTADMITAVTNSLTGSYQADIRAESTPR
jgi:DNA-binding MarR family transcriptional regulator